MSPTSRNRALAAAALTLAMAPAWSRAAEMPIAPRVPRPALPFLPSTLALGPEAESLGLTPRLAASLSLALDARLWQEAEAPAAQDDGVQGEPWAFLRGEPYVFEVGRSRELDGHLDLSGFLRAGVGTANTTRWPGEDQTLSRAALDNARLALDAGVGPIRAYVSLEGSTDGGRQYVLHTGEGGEVEVYDAWGELAFGEHVDLRFGRFRAPVCFSALLDENELLFLDRTGIGQQWFERDDGVALHARGARLEGWLALQNGSDGSGDELAITARGVLRLFGEGYAPRREGAYDADLGETVYLGLGLYEDQALEDSRTYVAEAYYSFEAFSLAGEALVPEQGFVDGGEFWNATASAMLVPERWEVAARYEDFRDRAGARLWRAGVVRYLRGPDTKLMLGLARLEHPDSHLDLTSVDLTLVASF